MKRFFGMILFVSVFFIGLGSLIEKAGAKFKSDEKALALIRAARQAIGGDNAIAGVQSLRIKGTTTNAWKINGAEKTEPGETEIALQLPDQLSKTIKIGKVDGENAEQVVNKRVETVVVRTDKGENHLVTRGEGSGSGIGIGVEPAGKIIVIQKDDGTVEDLKGGESGNAIVHPGDKNVFIRQGDDQQVRQEVAKAGVWHERMRQNELFRLALGLLLSSPAGIEPDYIFGGESEIDGTLCNLVIAEFGGSSIKLYLNSASNLPVMMAYSGEAFPKMVTFNKEVPGPGEPAKDVMFFRTNGPETADMQTRFSDYRSVNGVQLPYHWKTTGGDVREEFDVTSYDVNPADIASSFENNKVMVRVKKEGQ